MESNELSYSEYLKCKNACVKVEISRHSGLCIRTLRELRSDISTFLELDFESYQPRSTNEENSWYRTFYFLKSSILSSINHTLNVIARAEKCGTTNLSPLFIAVFRLFVSSRSLEEILQSTDRFFLLDSVVTVDRADIHLIRFLESVKGYGPRHPISRGYRSLALYKFMFSVINFAEELIAEHVLNQSSTIPSSLFPSMPLDFEPEELYHGSGFLIRDNFVITNKHVIEETMSDETLEIIILNETIGKLPCVVVHCDGANDLALLYCPFLGIMQHGICPLKLSEEAMWPSLSVFSFGYPLTHTGRGALFVKGYVSGVNERYGREPFVVLNCVLNPGNSGSPVFRRIGDDIRVVGVVSQKHKKEILTLEKEIMFLEEERSTLQEMNGAFDSSDQFWKSVSLKMYDALNETHCQFGYGNVVPGHLVVEFLSDPSVTSIIDSLKEIELPIEM